MIGKRMLLENIEKVHTTEMGIDRIKKNLAITVQNPVEFCKNKVLDEDAIIYKKGKNYYCEVDNTRITINASSYTIITAHTIK